MARARECKPLAESLRGIRRELRLWLIDWHLVRILSLAGNTLSDDERAAVAVLLKHGDTPRP